LPANSFFGVFHAADKKILKKTDQSIIFFPQPAESKGFFLHTAFDHMSG
jgi:hypothetical protein